MKPARIIVICVAAVAAIGLALVVRAMGSPAKEPVAVASAARVEARPMAKVLAIDQSTRAGDDEQTVIGATATLEVGPRDAEALALAKSEGELSLILRSYADTGGPSGRVSAGPRESSAVRVYRGGAPEVVVVQ